MTPTFDVLGIGENSVDLVLVLPAAPAPTGDRNKLRIRRRHVLCGGQTATAMTACARLGLHVSYVGAVGDDEYGRLIRETLSREGVHHEAAPVCAAPNRYAVILVDESTGERLVLWEKAPGLTVPPETVTDALVASARLVHVDDTDPAIALRAARSARAAGRPVTCDIDHVSAHTRELLETISIVVVAEHVPTQLTGFADHEQALRRVRTWHDGLLIVTLGADGCMALDGDRLLHAPGFAVDVVDTTGAGDVFRGGFIYAYLQGWPVERALRFANAAAAVSVQRVGAVNGAPTLEEVRGFLNGT